MVTTSASGSPPSLARRLRTGDAVAIGLSSMIGAGLFASFAPAAAAAGWGLLVGLAVAGLVAWCNASSSAQLAAQYPVAGGTYVYGRERLGAWPGFLAGWGFVVGKTASAAAMALTAATYLVPPSWVRPVAVLAVVVLTVVNLVGITRTALAARVIVTVTLVLLTAAVVVTLATHGGDWQQPGPGDWLAAGPYGILQSAGLLFFAFAGYARVATLGEEVVDPARTIPRAIVIALVATGLLYAAVGSVLLLVLGPAGIANTPAPIAAAVTTSGLAQFAWLARIGAGVASLGALLALVAGIGRTAMAMARQADLPPALAAVHPRWATPYRAEIATGLLVVTVVLLADLRGAIGFSSFGVLVYYAVANAAAWTQHGEHRRFARIWQGIGLVGCLILVATLPWQAVLAGTGVFAVGVVLRSVAVRLRNRDRNVSSRPGHDR